MAFIKSSARHVEGNDPVEQSNSTSTEDMSGAEDEEPDMSEAEDEEPAKSQPNPAIYSKRLNELVSGLLTEEDSIDERIQEFLQDEQQVGEVIIMGGNRDAMALVNHNLIDVQNLGWMVLAANIKNKYIPKDLAENSLLNLGVGPLMMQTLEKSTTAKSLSMLMHACREILIPSDPLIGSFAFNPNAAQALCAAVNVICDGDKKDSKAIINDENEALTYQTWLQLMQQVVVLFDDNAKHEFVKKNGLQAVYSVKWRCKNYTELVQMAAFISNIL